MGYDLGRETTTVSAVREGIFFIDGGFGSGLLLRLTSRQYSASAELDSAHPAILLWQRDISNGIDHNQHTMAQNAVCQNQFIIFLSGMSLECLRLSGGAACAIATEQ